MKSRHQYTLQKEVEFTILDHLTLKFLLKKIGQGLVRLWTSTRYWLHKMSFGAFTNIKVSWFKMSLLALMIFIFFKKDLHFQIHMNAPSNAVAVSNSSSNNIEQLGLLPSGFSFGESEDNDKVANSIAALALSKSDVEAYIKRFAKVAIVEQEKFGIPASIKMAQGLLESQAGKGTLATQTNNHFGAPFQAESFGSAWENWRAHSLLITHERSKFKTLLRYGTDYKSWAKGLNDLGYSRQANYGQILIQLIEEYEMYRLDEMKV
ncbi:MAG: glucosaminidase domain-containing protein [Bacteroidota bacterium]